MIQFGSNYSWLFYIFAGNKADSTVPILITYVEHRLLFINELHRQTATAAPGLHTVCQNSYATASLEPWNQK